MAKSKSKQEEALQILDDLGSFTPLPEGSVPPASSSEAADAASGEADVLAFIDEITQKSAEPTRAATTHLERPLSRSGTPTIRKSTERVRLGGSGLSSTSTTPSKSAATPATNPSTPVESAQPAGAASSSWGWGSVWNTASAAIQQARTAVDEQVKHLPKNEQARKWGEGMLEYAKSAQLDKFGQDFKRVGLNTLTDILNVVAPPISEHEVIQVWLSHDMKGYDGVESLVYRALARVLEQVEGGDLIVNRGQESRPRDGAPGDGRDLNAVESYDAAVKLSQANIVEVMKTRVGQTSKESPMQTPTTYSNVFLRIQPFLATYNVPSSDAGTSGDSVEQLHFLLYFADPSHNLVHTTITQSVPRKWLDIWDDYEWVEDLVAETLRVAVEVIGQEYVVSRMGWGRKDQAAETQPEEKKNAVEKNDIGKGED